MTLRAIIWVAAAALAAGVISVFYNTRIPGKFVRALLEIDALAPETAMTAEELGVKMTPVLRRELRPGTPLSKVVIKTADGRFYIDPDKADMARKKYRDEKATVVYVLLLMLMICVAAAASTYIFPGVIEYVEATFKELFGQGR